MAEAVKNAVVQRWLKVAGAVCLLSILSATVQCIGCSVREENRFGQAKDATTYALAFGTYFSLVVLMVAGACAVVCLSHLLSDERRHD